jgi:hypothetical protein
MSALAVRWDTEHEESLNGKALTAMADALREAIKQAKLAYQFSPGSYTWSALDRCLAAAKALDQYIELRGESRGPMVAGKATTGPEGSHPAEPTDCADARIETVPATPVTQWLADHNEVNPEQG